jgi:hypothetical protein
MHHWNQLRFQDPKQADRVLKRAFKCASRMRCVNASQNSCYDAVS